MKHWKLWGRPALPALLALSCTMGGAQEFPSRPVKLILPSSPGNVADLAARTLVTPMAAALGQPVVVENIAGAGGITGTERLVHAPRDGHTLGLISNNHVINPSVIKAIPFDSVKDVSVITVLGTTPLVLVAHPSVAARDVRELLALARASPGKLNYGSSGNGTVLHLAGVLLVGETGVNLQHVPYKGFAGMLNDLLGGQIQLGFAGLSTVAPHIKAGKLRALALSTQVRSPALPDVPPLAEAGVPGYSFDAWMALVAPAGLPQPVLDRLNQAARTALAAPEVKAVFQAQGITAVGSAADPASAFLQAELEKHTRLVRASGAKID